VRIAFIGDGSLNHVRRWAGWFAGRGHDVLLLSFEDVDGCGVPARRLRKRLPTKLAGYLAALGPLRREIARFEPDVVNALYVTGYGFVGVLAGRRPVVVSALGSDLLVDYPASAVHRAQVRFALSRADLVTTDADVLSAAAREAGAHADRILKAYFGIDETLFHPGDAVRDSDPPLVVSTRNLHPVYDLDTLLGAAPAINGAGARIILCGDGPERGRLEERAAREGLDAVFAGRQAPEAIAALLRRAAVYVSTARSDSTSVSLIEAMACGAVPVVTGIEANREWIDDGRGGRLVPPGDSAALAGAVADVLGDDAFAAAARERNRRIVEERGRFEDNMRRVEEAFLGLAGEDGR